MQFNNPASTQNENKNYDNSTLNKINGPVAFAILFITHGVRFRRHYARAEGGSGTQHQHELWHAGTPEQQRWG